MLNLIHAEWLKLTKRPLTWVLLAMFLALLVLQSLTQFALPLLVDKAGVSAQTLGPQLAEMQRRALFPGVFGAVFGHINGLGGIFAVVLAAGALGSEYSWGTLRTQLARQPGRVAYLLAKVVTLLLLLLVGMLLALLVGALLGVAFGALSGQRGALDGATLAALPLALLRALFVLLPYVLLAFSFAVVGRSLLVGVAGGLLYLVFEAGFGALALFADLGGTWQTLYNLTIGQNINTLVVLNAHAFGLRPEAATVALDPARLPSPLHATLVIGVYSALFLGTALYTAEYQHAGGAERARLRAAPRSGNRCTRPGAAALAAPRDAGNWRLQCAISWHCALYLCTPRRGRGVVDHRRMTNDQ